MDWSKAKNYLIIGLILTNLVLANSIYQERKPTAPNYYTAKGMHDLNTHLYRYGITVDIPLENKQIPTKTLLVEYQTIDSSKYPRLFQDYGTRLDILGGKHLILSLPEIKTIQTQDRALSYTIDFLETYFPKERFDIKSITENNTQIIITLTPLINGQILEDGRTIFTFNKFIGLEIEKILMEIIEEQEKPNEQITSVEAIIEAAPHLDYGSSIVDIDLIYYYSSSVNQTIFNTKTATAMPTWRIKTSNNQFQYILAIQ